MTPAKLCHPAPGEVAEVERNISKLFLAPSLPCVTCSLPDEVTGYRASDDDASEKRIHNPVGHPSSRLPKRNQTAKQNDCNNESNNELWNIGNSNRVELYAGSARGETQAAFLLIGLVIA